MTSSSVISFSRRLEAGELASMIGMLPPLPEVAQKILAKFSDEFISGNEIADIVECDPAISARLFGLANSAYFGLSTPVSAMREVVSRVLGPDTVRSLAFALATEETFDLSRCENFDSRRFWSRSLYSASAAQRIAEVIEDVPSEVREFAFLTGLCHGLGLLAVTCCYPQKTSQVFDWYDSDDSADLEYLCMEQFGFHFDEVTYQLALHWGLPDPVVDAYRFRSKKEEKRNLLAAVLNASVKAARYSENCSGDEGLEEVELPDLVEDLPYVEQDLLVVASLGTDAQRAATQARLQAMVG